MPTELTHSRPGENLFPRSFYSRINHEDHLAQRRLINGIRRSNYNEQHSLIRMRRNAKRNRLRRIEQHLEFQNFFQNRGLFSYLFG